MQQQEPLATTLFELEESLSSLRPQRRRQARRWATNLALWNSKPPEDLLADLPSKTTIRQAPQARRLVGQLPRVRQLRCRPRQALRESEHQ
jgi:hypothetical protein